MVRLLLFSIFWGQLNKYWLIDWLIDWLIRFYLFILINLQEGPDTVACELLAPRRLGRFERKNVDTPRETSPSGEERGETTVFRRVLTQKYYYEITWLFFRIVISFFLLTYILLLILSMRTHSLGQTRCTHLPRVYSWQMWESFPVYRPSLHFALPVAISRSQWPWMEEFEWGRQREAWKNVLWRDSWEMFKWGHLQIIWKAC